MAVYFNGKEYNADVFLPYLANIPRTKRNELLNSGVLENHPEYATDLAQRTGGAYLTNHFKGQIGADDVQNYDGETDLEAETNISYSQGMIVIGRMRAFTEKDFTWELTHEDFFDYAGERIANYQDDVDQADLLAILKALEGVSGLENHIVETGHIIDATTINSAVQKACGDLKDGFGLFICHSFVATQLENLNLLNHLKYTDPQGIERDLTLATVNGKTCIIDDDCPYDETTGTYTSYILGRGAFEYCDVGAKNPIRVWSDEVKNGGEDFISTKWRKILAPKGISFVENAAIKSPTREQLATSSNWELAKGSDGETTYPEKAIYICILKTLEEEPEEETTTGGDDAGGDEEQKG